MKPKHIELIPYDMTMEGHLGGRGDGCSIRVEFVVNSYNDMAEVIRIMSGECGNKTVMILPYRPEETEA